MIDDLIYYKPPSFKDKLIKGLYEDVDSITKSYDYPIDIEKIILILDIGISYTVNENIGSCRRKNNKYHMDINNALPIYHQRFVMAFQLGQMLFHIFKLPGEGDYSIVNNNFDIYESTKLNNDYNEKARQFAMELLIPKDKFIEESKKIFDKWSNEFDTLLLLTLLYINPISVTFLVHPDIMKKRLVELGLIEERSLTY